MCDEGVDSKKKKTTYKYIYTHSLISAAYPDCNKCVWGLYQFNGLNTEVKRGAVVCAGMCVYVALRSIKTY